MVPLEAGRLTVPGAARRATAPTAELLNWRAAAIVLVLLVWLIPIKSYRLPVNLPFNLEIYRLLIIALLFAWLVSALLSQVRVNAAGHGWPLALLAVTAVAALFANRTALAAGGQQGQAVKSLSFFLGYLVVFLLLTSTLSSLDDIEAAMRALVVGAALVAVAALAEARANYNLFDHLQSALPFLEHIGKERTNFAGGQLRVRASAQHPIALGAALTLMVPLAAYLSGRAASKARARLWIAAAGLLLMGALATKSRTVVLMLLAMLLALLWLHGRRLLRYWPLLILLAAVTHFASPGTISHLYKRFNPKGGLIQQQQSRPGQRGSGRLADLGVALRRWQGAPLVGRGLGTVAATGGTDTAPGRSESGTVEVIYDDQYMNTLVSLGAAGLIGVLWFVAGALAKLGRASRRARAHGKDLLVATAVSCAGFAAAMLTYDAFSFVQSSLLFFIVAALGLRARALLDA